ncbi:RNA polymerase, sigma-24 subunit, ECF subfamily [Niastella koreensis GR20-10]|uniref:RNA polymerase, sigma-24 subunit, ECF subfamily n=1 Tax=Niastella koreensis (strain DSM 17620 / KACC 11465 / NBRC 106392 / GR20-10) TaxID=700598 RepID=G8T9Q9_NIAKG|nr:RNA polymerase sigma-70 factor [Niastella koreensis]AEW00252.1 RNA polymerase, sigma-24 subunit, ECF subfamily [Niastella koreensis GR20-10]
MKHNFRDKSLLLEFKRGNTHAFRVVYDMFFPSLCFFAKRLVDNDGEGEDIAADSFVKLLNRHDSFDTLPNIKAFLYITTRNACLNYLRYTQRQHSSKRELNRLQEKTDEHALSYMVHAEVLREVEFEIEQLPNRCREIFKLIYYERKPADDIAEQLGISINTVWVQRAKAIQLIRTNLLKKGMLSALLCFLLINQES